MVIDYLSMRPATIETPTATYRRYWFLFDAGIGRIQTNGHAILDEEAGALTQTADQAWQFETLTGDLWEITRGGCNCGRAAIIPK